MTPANIIVASSVGVVLLAVTIGMSLKPADTIASNAPVAKVGDLVMTNDATACSDRGYWEIAASTGDPWEGAKVLRRMCVSIKPRQGRVTNLDAKLGIYEISSPNFSPVWISDRGFKVINKEVRT